MKAVGIILFGIETALTLAGCSAAPVIETPVPQELTARAEVMQTQTQQTIDQEATATAQAIEQQEKARQAENAERLSKIKTTWDFEWVDNNTNLNDSIENIVKKSWERARNDKIFQSYGVKVSFVLEFITGDDTGAFWAEGPYALNAHGSLSNCDVGFFTKSRIVDQELLDRMITATTDHYIDWENNKGLWDPDKEYTHLYYITQEEDEYGKFNGIYPPEGGFFRLFSDRKPEYISLEDAPAKLTEQEIQWAEEYHNIFDYRFGENGVERGDTSIFVDQSAAPAP